MDVHAEILKIYENSDRRKYEVRDMDRKNTYE